ncbi:hypothetical protein RUM43_000309 [Polyplax serrata]|uniref:Uncharacterized protein n=1 Tax=Polyplax serrata TaxID=468196 RepID=A0AAN8SDQ3_POLSC
MQHSLKSNSTSVYSAEDIKKLREIIRPAQEKLQEVLKRIEGAESENSNITYERYIALLNTYNVLSKDVPITIRDAVIKGIESKKLLTKHDCITKAGNEVITKLEGTFKKAHEDSEQLKRNVLVTIRSHNVILSGLVDYLAGLQQSKEAEIKVEDSVVAVAKILQDVAEKVNTFTDVVNQINAKVEDIKFKFFEEYVDIIHKAENTLRKSHADGVRKVVQCLK